MTSAAEIPAPPRSGSCRRRRSARAREAAAGLRPLPRRRRTGFLFLFFRHADLGEVLRQIAHLPSWTVAAGVGAALANVGVMALRWRYLLASAGYVVDTGRLFRTICAGIGINNVLPARAGDLVRIESVRRSDAVPAFVVVGTLFAERLLDGVVLSVFVLTGALLIGATGPLLLTAIALSAGSALGVVLVVLAAKRPGALAPARRADRRELRRGPGRLPRPADGPARHYLTLVTAMSVDVPQALSTGYVIVVHAFVVVPVSLLGLFFLRSVVPARRAAALEPA